MQSLASDERELCRLCREGMLFEVQEWIRAGKSLSVTGDDAKSPLVLAAGQGFHSLVKLIIDHGERPSQACMDIALAAAVHGGNCEVSRLLTARGATAARVNTRAVFASPNVEILGFCTEAGIDLTKGAPLACELVCKSGTALRFLERWHEQSEVVADQGAMALISAARDNEEWLVRRLVRAGADPRRRVPELGPCYEIGYPTTALEEAARGSTFRILLFLGVRRTDDERFARQAA